MAISGVERIIDCSTYEDYICSIYGNNTVGYWVTVRFHH